MVGGGGAGGRLQVNLVSMLEQSNEKHTLNSVLKISKTGTLFIVFPTKVPLFTMSIMVPSLYFYP